jgi:hypothetical protein
MNESKEEEPNISTTEELNEDESMPMIGSQSIPSEGAEIPSVSDTTEPESEIPTEESNGELEGPIAESMEREPSEEVADEHQEEVAEEFPEEETKEESVTSETKPEKAQLVLKKASNFRQKLTKTKRKLASLDDSQKDKIRSDLVNEFVSILKLYKHKTTRKKYIRRLNGLRTTFNQSLNKLNGTTRQRRRKSKKQPVQEPSPINEEVEESQEEGVSGNPL